MEVNGFSKKIGRAGEGRMTLETKKTSKRRMKAVIAAGLLGLLAVPSLARAADYCVTWAGGGPYISYMVGKAFKTPPKGGCKSFNGFVQVESEFTFSNYVVTGSGCTSFSGTALNLNLMFNSVVGPTSLKVDINPTSLTGSGKVCTMDVGNGGGCVNVTVAADDRCPKAPYPGP